MIPTSMVATLLAMAATATGQAPFEHRGAYLNIAYGFSAAPLSPDTWSAREWAEYLDGLSAAGITHLHFFLWGDIELSVHDSTVNAERNAQLHRRLRVVIREAHRRGRKVVFWFSPSLIPQDIHAAHPELHAESVYAGFPLLCLSRPESWSLMQRVYGEELRWFAEADAFSVIPYDPGGCMCGECAPRQPELLEQLAMTFGGIAREVNPDAELIVCLWASWAIEAEIGQTIREPFLDRLAEAVAEPADITIMDSAVEPRTSLGMARDRGFRTLAFEALTDWENGWWFPAPLYAEAQHIVTRAAGVGAEGVVTQCLRPGSRSIATWVLAALMADPNASRTDALAAYARHIAPDASSPEGLVEALETLDDAVLRGADASTWLRIAQAVEGALGRPAGEGETQLRSIVDGARLLSIASAAYDSPPGADDAYATFGELRLESVYARVSVTEETFDLLGKWAREGRGEHQF